VRGPRRIVCLTEETTELLYLLGEEERIVGISAYTVRPPQAKTKPVVSAFIHGSVPRITALKPDLVIGFSDIQANLAHDLVAAGMNVLITNQRSIAEILETMLLIGEIVGRHSETRTLVDGWHASMDKIRQKTENLKRPRVFFQEWDEPIISGIRWVSELIEIVGGQDIFADKREAPMAKDRISTPAEVALRTPDVLVGSWCGKPMDFEWIYSRPEWKDLSFVRNRRVHEIDSSIILQPGPALFLEGMQALMQAVHA
jgi:iron complex transport system substrate-binding protein